MQKRKNLKLCIKRLSVNVILYHTTLVDFVRIAPQKNVSADVR